MQTINLVNARLTIDETIQRRYSRLLWAMRDAAILSRSEAVCAIRTWQFMRSQWSCEAVNHYGGFHELIKGARRAWHWRVLNAANYGIHYPSIS